MSKAAHFVYLSLMTLLVVFTLAKHLFREREIIIFQQVPCG
jgi:positive regulator of sigma E activity